MERFKIYLDMDGVLCNFHNRYAELFGKWPTAQDRAEKHFNDNWKTFIESGAFRTLEWFQGGAELVEYVKLLNADTEILSSLGGAKHQETVARDKTYWLETHGVWFKPNFVVHRSHKKNYASKWSVMIDDTPDVIESFTEAGGIGILHKGDVTEVIDTLTMHYNLYHLYLDGRDHDPYDIPVEIPVGL